MTSTVSIAEQLPLHRELLFVTVICLAQLYTQAGLGQAIPILHVIGDNYGIANGGDLSWYIAGYSLTVGTFILFAGRLGDMFGYKTIFLLGMAWFSVWSMVTGLAVYSNHVLFTFARVLQGIGPALCLPNALAILGATYQPGKRKSMVFAAFAATAPGGSILGSLFASLFALAWWPWAWWCFALVLAGTTVLGYYAIPPCPPDHQARIPSTWKGKLAYMDLPGAITGITGLVLFNFAWNQAPIESWTTPYVYVTLILGVLFVAAFFVIEVKYAKTPLLPFDALSTDVSFVLGAVSCGWACFGIWFWYTWQFLEEIRGVSPLLGTAQICPVAVSGLLAAAFTGLLIHKIGPAWVMTMALCAFFTGTTLMATAPIDQTYWAQTFVSVIIQPWGMDMSFPAATLILSNAVSKRHQGIAASLVNTVVNYSIALGLGFAGTVEYQVSNGGQTQEDKLKGYRGAYYMGMGISGLGVIICLTFVYKSHFVKRSKSKHTEKA
ncbi:major facilitator superfamily domain-containing protein [Truncatella angustata]|uniref:Major facilitator superfamily domain-containing protein n=1 Tax=Truncatella angustata TaxID=152316 RepID=A0A9P8UZ98_9PEZI|nr:major facilitator superfamily domain-containing protein [Truncatella angustata]KAH6661150.1 major facilitator superfamily domain-containing protein [Truncatella angustata]